MIQQYMIPTDMIPKQNKINQQNKKTWMEVCGSSNLGALYKSGKETIGCCCFF